MKKSKEFIIERGGNPSNTNWTKGWAILRYLNNQESTGFCYRLFAKFFGIKLEIGERKRIKITIEEIKK